MRGVNLRPTCIVMNITWPSYCAAVKILLYEILAPHLDYRADSVDVYLTHTTRTHFVCFAYETRFRHQKVGSAVTRNFLRKLLHNEKRVLIGNLRHKDIENETSVVSPILQKHNNYSFYVYCCLVCSQWLKSKYRPANWLTRCRRVKTAFEPQTRL